MKLTNEYGIPQTFINVLERPTYNKGKAHLSATQLLNSPKIVALTRKFDDEIEQDASDMVWSVVGSAIHNFLEQGKDENHIVEQRIHIEHDGWHITGAIDLQEVAPDGIHVKDYKFTSVWAAMNEKPEWENQLNIYAWLVEKVKKVPVKSVTIAAMLRDWSRRDREKDGYPKAPILEIPIKLWPMEEREAYIAKRISLHSACEFAIETDGGLPDCTPEEMWEKPTVWAVRKKGNVRAKALYESEALAKEALEQHGKDYEIEVRQGERTRCANFCPVSQYCQQYRDYLSTKENV
tara:strand:- start:23762 stop:24640 length:879 start_codon:yes stop_codon:yes gene_type:complete